MKKILTAVGSDSISRYLRENKYEVIDDISYQDGVFEFIKREFVDVLIVSPKLSGEYDKYIFLEKIRQIDKKVKIIVIIDEIDDTYKSFLYTKGIFDIFIDGKSSIEDMLRAIDKDVLEAQKYDLRQTNIINTKEQGKKVKTDSRVDLTPKFNRQQIITFAGLGSCGKTTIASNFAKNLAKKTKAKILLIDLDIVNAGLNHFIGVKKEPTNPEYILPADKNSSLNYMIEAIDKRKLNANTFEKYVVKLKEVPNLDILTGNKSLYICKNILSLEYYLRILEIAKSIYDYIIIDTSENIFLDSMQFSLLNSTKAFIIAEGNYISLERTCRLIFELFPIWGVMNNKVEVIINKYNQKSLDKTIINEILKGVSIAGYISFSNKYEELINTGDINLLSEFEDEYNFILKKVYENEMYKSNSKHFLDKFLEIKEKIYRKVYGRTEGVC